MSLWFKRVRARRFAVSLVLLVGSTILTLLTLEIVLRFSVGLPPVDAPYSPFRLGQLTQSPSYQRDDYLGWRPQPKVRVIHNREGIFESTFTTNSEGLRGKEIPKDRKPGEVRVLLLGDSMTWGWGVNDDQTFATRLEQLLGNVTVINLGVTAYGLEQEYRYLLSTGLSYRPNLVVVNVFSNDIDDYDPNKDVRAGFSNPGPPPAPDPGASLFLKLKRFAAAKSALYNFVIGRINSSRHLVNFLVWIGIKSNLEGYESLGGDLRPALRIYPPSLQAGLERACDVLLKMKQLTDSHNIAFLIAFIPSSIQFSEETLKLSISYTRFQEDDFEVDKPDRLIREFAAAHGIPFLNPVEEFRRESAKNGRLLYFAPYDPHLNAKGHDLYARVLARWIPKYLSPQGHKVVVEEK